jgi:hypothetical protein
MPADRQVAPSSTEGRPAAETRIQAALEHIQTALQGLKYGQVTITVQDGVVVLVERTEKKRTV